MSTLISNAVPSNAVAAVLGYKLETADFSKSTPNLPMRIAILAEANTSKSLTDFSKFSFTSLKAVADRFGAGGVAYLVARVLRPMSGGGLAGIPIDIFPVEPNAGQTATVKTLTITGTATAAVKHTALIAGHDNIDGQYFSVNIASGDTPTVIAGKYVTAINNVIGSPVTATNSAGVVTLTTKWTGISSVYDLSISTGLNAGGVSYAISTTAGTGTGKVSEALARFENTWYTIVINPYGADSSVLNTLESFNGKPDPDAPTGRYAFNVFKPFISFFSKSTLDPITDVVLSSRASEVTNCYCPAPNVTHFPFEVAADVARVVAKTANDYPHQDYIDKKYPESVVLATAIGNMASWEYRDLAVNAALSTVDMQDGKLIIKDLVTTYNPSTEAVKQFRYVRDLILDWNVFFAYRYYEELYMKGKTIVKDGSIVDAPNTISPKKWKGILVDMFRDLEKRAIVADSQFSINGNQCAINGTNPQRIDTAFPYKRTGIVRIASTTAIAGFNFNN